MTKYPAFLILAILSGNAFAQAPAPRHACDIAGTILKIEDVQKSPWKKDKAPSPFTMVERQVSVRIEERKPHDPATTAASDCPRTKEGFRIFKVCSPTPIKTDDRIHATEGEDPVTPETPKCLFDIYVERPLP